MAKNYERGEMDRTEPEVRKDMRVKDIETEKQLARDIAEENSQKPFGSKRG